MAGNGVVPALNMVCRALASEDQKIATATPIYHPFLSAPRYQDRAIVRLPAHYEYPSWRFPVEGLRTAAARGDIGVLLLSNPYNPVGRALTRAELEEITGICIAHDITLCSDEIHCELLLDDVRHVPSASLSVAASMQTITLMAHTKTFNIAGIGGGFAVIQDVERRQRFEAVSKGMTASIGPFVYDTMLAAFTECDAWRLALLRYLRENRDVMADAINRMPGLRVNHVEATYLAWIDVSALALDDPLAFFAAAGVGLSEGAQFGDDNFVRLNFACPRVTLVEALGRIRKAVEAHMRTRPHKG